MSDVRVARATAVAAITFVLLALFLAVRPHPTGLEAAIDRALRAPAGSLWFDGFRAVSVAGSLAVVAIGAAVLGVECWRRGHRALGLMCILGTGMAGVTSTVLKPIVARPRPPTAALTGESGFGFPSGHATGATALAVCVIAAACVLLPRGARRSWAIAVALAYALLIGVSRIVVGAHHSADILGGWLLGSAVALAAVVSLRYCERRTPNPDSGPVQPGRGLLEP